MATKKKTDEEKAMEATIEEILGPPPDYSHNLDVENHDPQAELDRARATMTGTFPLAEMDKQTRRKKATKTRRERNARSSA